MRTTLEFKGFSKRVLDRAVKIGLARSKTEALRLGILALNREYHLVKPGEEELALNKMERISREIRSGKRKVFSEKAVLQKYGLE